MCYNHVMRYVSYLTFFMFEHYRKQNKFREKTQKNEGRMPTKSQISQLPNVIAFENGTS